MIYWLNADSRKFLSRDYLPEGVSPESRMEAIAKQAEVYLGISGFANKFLSYLHKGYYSLSTPVWTNYGTTRGLPVSCFGSYVSDTMESILGKVAEVGTMCKSGGGTSGYFGDLRSRGARISTGGDSSGPIHFMELFDNTASVVSQSSTRRGSFAAYLPVRHPDIKEFLKIRDTGNKIQEMSLGVNIDNDWMKEMRDGDTDKRKIWSLIIKKRFQSGYPYLHFVDNANLNGPQVYKDKGLTIKGSNLCSEVELLSDEANSFVCVLSSINLLHWDEIVKTDAVETLLQFLDTVNEEFIIKTTNMRFMESANHFAKTQRALGLGVLGWHSYLQSKMIPFESLQAKSLNNTIFKTIRKKCDSTTEEMARIYGEPELLVGYGRRNITTMAIAPTTSSSFILGQVSPSIEPINSNYFTKDLAKGVYGYKNPNLKAILKNHEKDNTETWKSILEHGGSVQHLKFLSDNEREVFKTFGEISQKEIVIQACQRSVYVDQGQSLNIMIPPSTPARDVSQLLIYGWENGLKAFYYHRGGNASQLLARNINECKSCES